MTSLRKKLLGAISTIMLARLAGAILGFTAQVVLARFLGAEGLANYFIALSLASVLAIIFCLGIPSITTATLSRLRAQGAINEAIAFVTNTRRLVTYVTGTFIVVGFVAIVLFFGHDTNLRDTLLLGLSCVPATVLLCLNGTTANAFSSFKTAYLPDLLVRPALALLASGLIAASFLPSSVLTVLTIQAIGLSIAAVAQHTAVGKIMQTELHDNAPSQTAPTGDKSEMPWLKNALPMIPTALFMGLFADVQILISGLFLTASDLAVFGICLKLVFLFGFVIQLTHQVFLPGMASAHGAGQFERRDADIGHANTIATIASLAALMGCAVLGDQILRIFFPDIGGGAIVLSLLALSQLIRALMGPTIQILTLTGFEKQTINVSAGALLLLAILNVTLIPMYGIIGACFAVLLAYGVWSIWLAIVAHRKTTITTAIWLPQLLLRA